MVRHKEMQMIKPNYLVKGDKIIITSPAGRVNKESVDKCVSDLMNFGFSVEVTKHCTSNYYNYSATDEIRLEELQSALDNKEAAAIMCSRGGYGTGRILDKLDFYGMTNYPKWLIGFSDITHLHLKLNKLCIMSIHGAMTKSFSLSEDKESVRSLINVLQGDKISYSYSTNNLNRVGETKAQLVGGNLSIIYGMQGTPYEIDTNNKILLIEDLNEYLYHLDRIMINLKLSGKLAGLRGLLVGGFTDMKDNQNPFGKNAYEIIHEHIADYDFPVCFNFPVGHISNNQSIIIGATYKFSVSSEKVILESGNH
ncbi:MAG: LD-carboxypeptidase [Bacteroidales bacterium]|nr:LD-carboxypeptidase [Bacteroidales bacterium]